jgi:hypothetical protein
MRTAPLQFERPSRRSPGSRAKSVPTCQGLRPRRVEEALALSRLSVLPSATITASAPRTNLKLSRLHGWPAGSPVNASSRTSRCATHDSGPVWFAIPLLLRTFTFALCRSPGALSYFISPFVKRPQVAARTALTILNERLLVFYALAVGKRRRGDQFGENSLLERVSATAEEGQFVRLTQPPV